NAEYLCLFDPTVSPAQSSGHPPPCTPASAQTPSPPYRTDAQNVSMYAPRTRTGRRAPVPPGSRPSRSVAIRTPRPHAQTTSCSPSRREPAPKRTSATHPGTARNAHRPLSPHRPASSHTPVPTSASGRQPQPQATQLSPESAPAPAPLPLHLVSRRPPVALTMLRPHVQRTVLIMVAQIPRT